MTWPSCRGGARLGLPLQPQAAAAQHPVCSRHPWLPQQHHHQQQQQGKQMRWACIWGWQIRWTTWAAGMLLPHIYGALVSAGMGVGEKIGAGLWLGSPCDQVSRRLSLPHAVWGLLAEHTDLQLDWVGTTRYRWPRLIDISGPSPPVFCKMKETWWASLAPPLKGKPAKASSCTLWLKALSL